tara:strand:- start:1151 stop:1978 length:828 start_codon:yes stop_codon:yes gene_type:complete
MNVLKYNIEVSLKKRKSDKDIHYAINDSLIKDQSFDGDDYKSAIETEWGNLSQESIKLINSPDYLIGGFEKNGIRIYVFEIRKDGLKNKRNLTLEAVCFADLPVEKIVNDSFSKIKSVFEDVKTKYIEDSKILIYPFDSSSKDIWSPEMKIKADIISPFEFDKKQIGRWVFIGALTIILAAFYFTTDSVEPFLNPETNKIEGGDDFKNIYLSLMLSGFFYIILELAIHLLIPLLVNRNERKIQVKDLSSIVDKSDPFSKAVEKKPALSNPKIDEA